MDERYASWKTGIGAKVASKSISLEQVSAYFLSNGEPTLDSGRQEMLENLVDEFI